MKKERIIELRAVITREVFMHKALAKYIRRLVWGRIAADTVVEVQRFYGLI